MRRVRRLLVGTAVAVAVLLVAVAVFGYVTVRGPFPDTSGEVRLDGLDGPVEILRDGNGIPQVYADTSSDLFFAQGYVHAQDRFFEMDVRRHVTSGRLAEIFGEDAVETDTFVRTLGWRRVAESELPLVDDDTRRLLEAYASGVNAYIEGKSGSDLSLEYAVLSITGEEYRPEPWTPVDSIAWVKAMAWDLRSNMDDEIGRVLAGTSLPESRVAELWPAYPADHATIVDGTAPGPGAAAPAAVGPPAPDVAAAVATLTDAAAAAAAVPTLLGTGDGIGSNSWVVSGDRTASGEPLLANDPHLAPSMPGIWYQVGLHCRELDDTCPYDVAGFSFSGLPGVVVGHNRRIAWGVTTMYADVADLYLEQVVGSTYLYDGELVPLETRTETIEVAGGDDREIVVRSTRHGPLISDVDDDIADVGEGRTRGVVPADYEVALRWTALDPSPTVAAVFQLGRAQDWEDFREAARTFDVPSQNLVYADVDGNIGYQAPGRIPIRGMGDGRWPVPGWDPRYEWTGTVEFDDLPSVLNPDDGMIVTANNRVAGPSYPFELGADTAAGYRSERILDLLSGLDDATVDDFTTLQADTYNANAERLVPFLLDLQLGTPYFREGQDTLRGWDFTQPADSAAAAYFNVVWSYVLELTFRDELPESQWPGGGERWFNVVDRIIDDRDAEWWDDQGTERIEDRDEILARSMQLARDELTSRLARNPDRWSWGELHRLELVNSTLGESGIGLVEALFNRGPLELGGGGGTVNATSWDAAEGFEVTAVPSMRMVVDLADLDASRWIQLTGNSGHAFHGNYLDQAGPWAAGETLPWAFTPGAVQESAEATLTLVPSTP
ncbi:penicillin amidase [Aeromicrobium marinum DSM 15272]|uniref:Penicillin amidase n=1 Tax=Aeromicrobium marinum DSM 15272 TaxID=585531 RepID=E2SDJ0_9ACTN|nr:penicillin acylase family protein [Aeromicrobium marinum]EFQ82567.1 penicillin amidase [Aeromicrobium marinum DSM 15272]